MVWQPYKIRTGLRKFRELRTGLSEHRGRPPSYDDQASIRVYIEIEARARLLTKGRILPLLRHQKLRLEGTDGRPTPLNGQDIQRLRKRYGEGKLEALAWQEMKFMGRPHPEWFKIQRTIDAREAELRSSAMSELFFLKMM